MAMKTQYMVKETTSTQGTGTYSLAGAAAGFLSFVTGIGNGNSCYYKCDDGSTWEVGVGTVTDGSPDTLTRDRIVANSLGTTDPINWGAGTRNIFVTTNAEDPMLGENNLSEVAAPATARSNLGAAGLADDNSFTGSIDFSGDGRLKLPAGADKYAT